MERVTSLTKEAREVCERHKPLPFQEANEFDEGVEATPLRAERAPSRKAEELSVAADPSPVEAEYHSEDSGPRGDRP